MLVLKVTFTFDAFVAVAPVTVGRLDDVVKLIEMLVGFGEIRLPDESVAPVMSSTWVPTVGAVVKVMTAPVLVVVTPEQSEVHETLSSL